MNYQQTLEFLFQQLPMYQNQGKKAYKADLSNILSLCKILGNPEKQLKCIHIAGTNGKGSTAHFTASILQEAGYKTGLYTSPHLKDFRERVKINGQEISEQEVIHFVESFQEKFKGISPSFFEWTVALAFHYFNQEKVDIAVIETGLGGRLDSTNIIMPELSIITNIGLDHQDILGDTLELISKEKAGIIKKNIPVLIGDASGQEAVFEDFATRLEAPLFYSSAFDFPDFISSKKNTYQVLNMKCVYAAMKVLNDKQWEISESQIEAGINNWVKNTGIRGRYEKLQDNPIIIADTAHNTEGLSVLIEQIRKENYRQLHIVLSLVNEKKVDRFLANLPQEAVYYFTQSKNSRSIAALDLKEKASKFELQGLSYDDSNLALQTAKSNAQFDDLILISGSNFLVGELI